MIDSKDLRIGNYYEVDGTIYQVSRIDIFGFQGSPVKKANGMHTNGGRQQPIELTPDMLVKCGAEKMVDEENKYEQRYHGNPNLNFGYPVIYLDKNKVSYLAQNCAVPNGYLFFKHYRIDCKYLHQLQNLYFALTGNELEINL